MPVEEVDSSIIHTLKQSSVCCCQIMNYLLPFNETIVITKKLNDVFDIKLVIDCSFSLWHWWRRRKFSLSSWRTLVDLRMWTTWTCSRLQQRIVNEMTPLSTGLKIWFARWKRNTRKAKSNKSASFTLYLLMLYNKNAFVCFHLVFF